MLDADVWQRFLGQGTSACLVVCSHFFLCVHAQHQMRQLQC